MKSNIILLLIFCFIISIYSCQDDNSSANSSGIVVTTTAISNINNNTAVSGGNITYDGGSAITARGVCWSTSSNPTTANSHTNDGASVGIFVSNIAGLIADTLYYLRAYATNLNGTAYGNQIGFTTSISSGSCAGGTSVVTDLDGNVYNIVSIGNQCWFKENLKTSRFRNGVVIPSNLNNTQWPAITTGAYSVYNNDPSNNVTYGKLYNWYSIADPSGLCPSGWHVPNHSEWSQLVKYLDPLADTSGFGILSDTVGVAMKEVGNTHWIGASVSATNSSNFTGLPGGNRYINYGSIGLNGDWWCSTEYSTDYAIYHNLSSSWNGSQCSYGTKFTGRSVRCLKD